MYSFVHCPLRVRVLDGGYPPWRGGPIICSMCKIVATGVPVSRNSRGNELCGGAA
jgi:hypothetical protein